MIRTRSESRPLFKFSPDYTVFAWRHILLKKKKKSYLHSDQISQQEKKTTSCTSLPTSFQSLRPTERWIQQLKSVIPALLCEIRGRDKRITQKITGHVVWDVKRDRNKRSPASTRWKERTRTNSQTLSLDLAALIQTQHTHTVKIIIVRIYFIYH